MMKTAIVILNWNTVDYLKKFIPFLMESTEGLDAGIVVADNGSTDGSADETERLFPSVKLIRFDRNYGFTGGYNKALAEVDAEYFVLLNSDVEVPRDWLRPLVEWMDSHPRCGACGPKLLRYDKRDTFEYAGAAGGLLDRFGFPYCRGRVMHSVEEDHGQYDTPTSVLWVSGACLMVRSSLWHKLGGLDERFWAHMEEIDLCWRLQLDGWMVDVVPASKVYHIGGGTLDNASPLKLKLNYRNNLLLLENNLPATLGSRSRARRRIFLRMCIDGCAAMVYLFTFRWSNFRAVVKAHGEYRSLRHPGPVTEGSPVHVEGLTKKILIFAR